jgi:hypothetical protein
MIAKMPGDKKIFMGNHLELICLLQAAEIERLCEFLDDYKLRCLCSYSGLGRSRGATSIGILMRYKSRSLLRSWPIKSLPKARILS